MNIGLAQESQKESALKREQMLQQVVLDQKNKIRELEQQVQVNNSNGVSVQRMKYQNEINQKNQAIEQLNQKLEEANEQLLKNKEYIMELLQVKEKEVYDVQQTGNYQKIQFEQEVLSFRQEYEKRLQEAESENQLLIKQLEKAKTYPQQKALDNYTTEEEYLRQIYKLKSLIHKIDNQYMAEIVYQKRAAEQAREHMQNLLKLNDEEKRVLKGKLEEMREVDQQVEQDVLLKFEEMKNELKNISNELNKRNSEILKMKQSNGENVYEILQRTYEGEIIWNQEKVEFQKQIRRTIQIYESKINHYEQELQNTTEMRVVEVEKYIRENTILIKEKETLTKALNDLKQLSHQREQTLQKECERYSKQIDALMESSKNRESILEQEIKKLNFSVFQLHKAFESRENLFMGSNNLNRNWEEVIQQLTQKFEQLCLDFRKSMQERKVNDYLKESKNLVKTLGEKQQEIEKQKFAVFDKRLSEKKKQIQEIERLFDRFVFLCNDYCQKLEFLKDKDNKEREKDNTIQNTQLDEFKPDMKIAIQQTFQAMKTELDVTRYEELLMQRDAELDKAKSHLLEFAKYYKDLEEKYNQKLSFEEKKYLNETEQKMSLEEQEELVLQRLNLDKNQLEKEVMSLKKNLQNLETEKKISLDMISRYENHFNKELNRIEQSYMKKIDELKGIVKKFKMVKKEQNPGESRSRTPQSTVRKRQTNTTMQSNTSSKLDIRQNQMQLNEKVLEQGEEIRKLLQDIEKSYLSNERVSQLMQENTIQHEKINELKNDSNWKKLLELSERIEIISSFPTKQFENQYYQFKQEITQLAEIRKTMEQNLKNRNTFQKTMEDNYLSLFDEEKVQKTLQNQSTIDNIAQLKEDLEMCQQIQNQEREAHKKELNIAVENLQNMLQIYEKKVDSCNQEINGLKKNLEDTKNNQKGVRDALDKEVKDLRRELNSIQKIVHETQQKRMEERKKFIQDISQIEDKIVKRQEQALKQFDNKVRKISNVFDQKSRILQQRQNLQSHENVIDSKMEDVKEKQYQQQIQSMNEELQILRQRDRERDEQISGLQKEFNEQIDQLKIVLENLHQEKCQLIDEVDYLNQLVGIKEKVNNNHYYSFTKEQ